MVGIRLQLKIQKLHRQHCESLCAVCKRAYAVLLGFVAQSWKQEVFPKQWSVIEKR